MIEEVTEEILADRTETDTILSEEAVQAAKDSGASLAVQKLSPTDPLTPIMTIILSAVGDQDTALLLSTAQVLWGVYAAKAAVWPGLQQQYVQRDLAQVLQGQVWEQVRTESTETKVDLQQKISNLQVIRDNCQTEIVRLEATGRANRSAAVGEIATQTPRAAGFAQGANNAGATLIRNPNDPAYRGDPLRVSRGTGRIFP